MSAYKLLKDSLTGEQNMVRRESDGAIIPFDEGNRDYKVYLAWVAEGNTPDPVEA